MRLTATFTLAAFLLGLPSGAGAAGGGDIAIVVNKANKTDSISLKDLKQIFAGERTRWPDGEKVQTLATSPAMPEHKAAVRFLFGMSEPEYQKYCIHAAFVGEQQKVPRESGASVAVLGLVAAVPGAVGFVRAGLVMPGTAVKILKVNGLAPGEAGYPLAEEK
jgi:ABC-type phosphate transport system substrate-binding protein